MGPEGNKLNKLQRDHMRPAPKDRPGPLGPDRTLVCVGRAVTVARVVGGMVVERLEVRRLDWAGSI